jgi:penicillin-binding protein 2
VTVGIGQSYLVSTPIQMAMMTAALANGGKLLRPSIVRRIQASSGRVIFEHTPVIRWELPIKPEHFSSLREFMIGAVQDKMGTGRKSRVPGLTVAGKTGTSQVIRIREGPRKTGKVPYKERTHAIFVAYVDDMPEKIAVVVIVEHGGSGGTSAAPIARKVIARYYGLPDPGDGEDKSD